LSSSGTSSLVSESCPGVSRLARLRPRPSAGKCSWWSVLPASNPSLGLPVARPHSARLYAPRLRADAPAPRWNRPAHAVESTGRVRASLQLLLDPRPGPVLFPLREPVVPRLPRPVPLRNLMPLRTVFRTPQDAVDDLHHNSRPSPQRRTASHAEHSGGGRLAKPSTTCDRPLRTVLLQRSVETLRYRAIRYSQRLAEAGAVASVGSKGDSFDNAMAEVFNSLLHQTRDLTQA
jgi:transposase InsO family protein